MTAIVMAVLVRDADVLLCHRRVDREWYPDVWDLPGGHVEPGEPVDAALQRELLEELGITVGELPDPILGVNFDDIEGTVWALQHWHGEMHNAAPEEHDELRWIPVQEVADLDLAAPQLAQLCAIAVESLAASP